MPEQYDGKIYRLFSNMLCMLVRNSFPLFYIDGKGSSLDNLVEFKPFQARFTNLGATGRYGPTTLGSQYVGEDHEHMVTVTHGIQFWTVPYSGTYRITAVGAAGGYDLAGPDARGTFFLNKMNLK